MTGWDLPESAKIGGVSYKINADYRDVLEVIDRLNREDEMEYTRLYVALSLFYVDFPDVPEKDHGDALAWMFRFIGGGEDPDNRPATKTIDWEQDRGMIVADINRVAGCEIRALPFCHWWTFLAWFNGIGEGQLSTVVSIREKRRKGKKLTDWEREFYQDNRAKVDFRKKYSADELEEQERLKRLLGE